MSYCLPSSGAGLGAPSSADDAYFRAVVHGKYKLVQDIANGGSMFFDLEADPLELNNIASSSPHAERRLRAVYQAWLNQAASRENPSVPAN